ncbi:DUF4331 domain-containing protein [Sinosporangium siamense]|nr:DUF4331 domain-containing protein [Sinosporangium siamense]
METFRDRGPWRRAARSLTVLTAAGTLLTAALLTCPGPEVAEASNHADSPLQILDPQMDVTDLYAFTSPDRQDTVTVIWNYIPFELPVVPLPYYRFATRGFYDLHFDSTGDGKPELTYRWWYRNGDGSGDPKAPPSKGYPAFGAQGAVADPRNDPYHGMGPASGSPGSAARLNPAARRTIIPQTYKLELIRPGQPAKVLLDDAPVAPWPLGLDYRRKFDEAIVPLPGGGKTFSGPVKDPFFFDFRMIALTRVGLSVAPPFDFIAPFNVHSIAIQVPKSELALNGDVRRNPVVGIWATSSRETVSLTPGERRFRQVSRQGLSMFGDSVNPAPLRDIYHASSPDQDRSNVALREAVRKPYASLLTAPGLLTIPPATPRLDFEQFFLTGIAKATGPIKIDLNSHVLNQDADRSRIVPAEMTRLNMTTPVTARPNRFGLIGGDLQGWPNGRRLTDDVTVAFVRLSTGEPLRRGSLLPTWVSPVLGPAKAIRDVFPYEAYPDIR